MPAAEQSELLTFAYRFDENIRKKLWLEAWEQTHTEQLGRRLLLNNVQLMIKSVY